MICLANSSLAYRMGTSAHLSPLLRKVHRLGYTDARDLESLAIQRGLRYFGSLPKNEEPIAKHHSSSMENSSSLSNEELAIALINPSTPYSLNRIRMAAALIAGEGISPALIIRLAKMERCAPIVKHIAQCGSIVEPANPLWSALADQLPDSPPLKPDVLPHLSRFVAMSGISRHGKQQSMQWIRPTA